MARSLKFVVLGVTTLEVGEMLGSMAQALNGSEVTSGELTGSRIYRFTCDEKTEGAAQRKVSVYGVSMELDFRGTIALLTKNADGVVGVVPADLTRVEESRRVLGSLHRVMQARQGEEKEFPFAIQYHWPFQGGAASPEELDGVLGVNPQAAERVFSRAGGEGADKGIRALIEKFSKAKVVA